VLVTLALAACGDDDGSDLPEFTGGEGPTASASASATPLPDPIDAIGATLPAPGTKLGDDKNPITVGRTLAGDGAKEAVQIAYLAFWVERARALRVVRVDDAALDKVATGDAADRVVFSVRDLADKKRHTEGGSTVNVVALKVEGARATVTDCFQDRSTDRDAKGNAVEAPDFEPVPITTTLELSGTWRVSRVVPAKESACA
jgi:hypothetical protein